MTITFDYNGPYQTLYKKTLVYKELNSSCKVLELIFRNDFLSSVLAKCVRDENCRGDFPPTSPHDLKPIFVFIDEDFEINQIRPKFLSL